MEGYNVGIDDNIFSKHVSTLYIRQKPHKGDHTRRTHGYKCPAETTCQVRQRARRLRLIMSENLDKYSEYNKILRSWFVAFGVGGPAIFLVNEEVRNKLIDTGNMQCVVILFLLGATVQIAIAFINKVINWYVHQGKEGEFAKTRRYRWSETITNWFWLDIAADVMTFSAFGLAVWKVFTSFVDITY